MKVLVVGDGENDDAGFVGQRLAEHGATFTTLDRRNRAQLARAPGPVDLVVLLGSADAVYDPARTGVVAAEVDLVHRARSEGRPILGICYGGQLLARAAGARVAPAARPEVGWITLQSEDHRLAPSGPWFQFHADRWWPTDGSTVLAHTDLAPQAFRWGRAFGVQFHPEVQPAVAAGWVRKYTSVVQRSGVDPEAVLADIDRIGPGAAARCAELVDAFLEDVAAGEDRAAREDGPAEEHGPAGRDGTRGRDR